MHATIRFNWQYRGVFDCFGLSQVMSVFKDTPAAAQAFIYAEEEFAKQERQEG